MSARVILTRGLRFRLTAGYALLFALLLIGIAALFRERLAIQLNAEAHDMLDQEWAAMKGYLHIERFRRMDTAPAYWQPDWEFDQNDPDEDFIVERLKRVYVLTDAKAADGRSPPSTSPGHRTAQGNRRPPSTAAQPVWKRSRSAARHAVSDPRRRGSTNDKHHNPFYVAIGRPMDESDKILKRYTWMYVGLIPFSLSLRVPAGMVADGPGADAGDGGRPGCATHLRI